MGFQSCDVGVAWQPPLWARPHRAPGARPAEEQLCVGGPLSTLLPQPCSVPREIFPYLVVVIGLENVLVLTKSVVSTPVDLEVKLRIAQGNRREWEAWRRGLCCTSSCRGNGEPRSLPRPASTNMPTC